MQEIINDDSDLHCVIKKLDYLRTIAYKIMQKEYKYLDLPRDTNSIIDDILEMGVTDEEKEFRVNRLILRNLDDFKELARDIISKIKSFSYLLFYHFNSLKQ